MNEDKKNLSIFCKFLNWIKSLFNRKEKEPPNIYPFF